MQSFDRLFKRREFHPLMRVWIEIKKSVHFFSKLLKFHPLMRVWIEISSGCLFSVGRDCFTLL